MSPDLAGIEFDWFATDSKGEFALFATAGEGFYPESVAKHHKEHMSISESMPAPHVGTSEVWQDYAALGLFVFDWALPGGPYRKVASPKKIVSPALATKILAVANLPRLSGSFSGIQVVTAWQ